jgi:hypothetical protein
MTEAQWLAGTDPRMMRWFLLEGQAKERKLRLFGSACCRRMWHLLSNERSRRAVEAAERYADADADGEELRFARLGAENVAETLIASAPTAEREAQASAAFAALSVTVDDWRSADYTSSNATSAAYHAATAANVPSAADARDGERAAQACLLRDIFGIPFRSISICPAWLTWNSGTVVRLAQAAYENRILPAGTRNNARLSVLADALEEAGCNDELILGHLRGGGEHYRGCFVVDALLGER